MPSLSSKIMANLKWGGEEVSGTEAFGEGLPFLFPHWLAHCLSLPRAWQLKWLGALQFWDEGPLLRPRASVPRECLLGVLAAVAWKFHPTSSLHLGSSILGASRPLLVQSRGISSLFLSFLFSQPQESASVSVPLPFIKARNEIIFSQQLLYSLAWDWEKGIQGHLWWVLLGIVPQDFASAALWTFRKNLHSTINCSLWWVIKVTPLWAILIPASSYSPGKKDKKGKIATENPPLS